MCSFQHVLMYLFCYLEMRMKQCMFWILLLMVVGVAQATNHTNDTDGNMSQCNASDATCPCSMFEVYDDGQCKKCEI